MNILDGIIRQTRKFANKKNVKLDKNSVIEHAISYIKELQNVNEILTKKLDVANLQIANLQQMVLSHNGMKYSIEQIMYRDVIACALL